MQIFIMVYTGFGKTVSICTYLKLYKVLVKSVLMYNQTDMDFKQTTKEQKQQQGEIYNHLLNIQHYMKRKILAYKSNFKLEMDEKTIKT